MEKEDLIKLIMTTYKPSTRLRLKALLKEADLVKEIDKYTSFMNSAVFDFRQRVNALISGHTSVPLCKHCHKEVKSYLVNEQRFGEFCSSSCIASGSLQKRIQTNIEKYGVENPFQAKSVKDKVKKTNLERYGVENPGQSKEIRAKVEQTNMEKFGSKYYSSTKECKDKVKKTNRERYGVDNVNKLPEYRDKIRQTNIERYGVENPMQNEAVKEKQRATVKEKYDVDNTFQAEEFKKKAKETSINRYGADHFLKTDSGKEKLKSSVNRKYGVYNVFQSEEIKTKIQDTNIDRYGVSNPQQNKEIREKTEQTNLNKYGSITVLTLSENKNKAKESKYNSQRHLFTDTDHYREEIIPEMLRKMKQTNLEKYGVEHVMQNKQILEKVWDTKKRNGSFKTSKGEQEVLSFVKAHYPSAAKKRFFPKDIEQKSLEVDVFIPELNLAIEYNGTYWHSELGGGKDKQYHLNKYNFLQDQGIQLIQIWEHDWQNSVKRPIIESILLNRMGKTQNRFYARKLTLQEVSQKEEKEFLTTNHLQGYTSSSYRVGLFDGDDLIQLLTFRKPRFSKKHEWELLRSATKINTMVVGGFKRLLKEFTTTHTGSLISYVNKMYFNGQSYEEAGFNALPDSRPAYWYTRDYATIENRVNYQKHKLKDKLEMFDESLTEVENMYLHGFDRLWDVGNKVFVLSM